MTSSVVHTPPPTTGSGNSYNAAIRYFGPRQQAAIRTTLIRWSRDDLGRELVRNINPLERFIPPDNMKSLLSVIYNARRKGLDELAILYKEECFKPVNIRVGGLVRGVRPMTIGRAVEKQAFVYYLYKKQRHCFRTKAMAHDFIQRLLSGDTMSATESSVLMSEFSAWVTWNDMPSATDPFEFARSTGLAEMIRACLGLDPEGRMTGKPILLLIYKRRTELYRPTIADAGLYRFFEPPPIGIDAHGLTKTRPPGMSTSVYSSMPRPEAVHAPQPFSHLEALEELP